MKLEGIFLAIIGIAFIIYIIYCIIDIIISTQKAKNKYFGRNNSYKAYIFVRIRNKYYNTNGYIRIESKKYSKKHKDILVCCPKYDWDHYHFYDYRIYKNGKPINKQYTLDGIRYFDNNDIKLLTINDF